jgi:NAD(P)-dependent dehydrogenase (short-subunit alcohol dehydrogenase family)
MQLQLTNGLQHNGAEMAQTRFEGQTVLITGAGSGMGRAAALRLAREGARLALLGRRAEPLETLGEEILRSGGTAISIPCDIADEDAVSAAIDRVQNKYDRLDGVFANAGQLGDFTPLADAPADAFDPLIATNLGGTFRTIKSCLSIMERGSVLINASWTAGSVMPGTGVYAATKGALVSMMRTWAVELGPRNIRVNAIHPGIILTPMAEEALDPQIAQKLSDHTPLQRNGAPEDVAGTVAWLLSEDSGFVTGQEVAIDGGFTIGGVRL